MIITDESKLLKECKDVSIFEADYIIKELEKELANSKSPGIGLAANQIGIDAKVCIIRAGRYSINLVNPKIVDKLDLCMFDNEGCLSYPDEWLTTKRFNEIVVKDLLNPEGIVCSALTAVVIQHEVGHLYGETMYDYQIKKPDGPNSPCWCGSGKKFKKCCVEKVIKV